MSVPSVSGAAMIALASALALSGCEREMRRFETPPDNPSTPRADTPRSSALQPAEARDDAVRLPAGNGEGYQENAFAVAQGKRLYRWYNCNGCHAQGGGGMGPALIDDQWRYGSEPAQIFSTIAQGRPNGMPSFGGHLSEDQIWQLTAYVRSMSGQLRKDVEPGRADSLQGNEPEVARDREPAKPGAK
jgi:cytochrome c oxidase cbb3-type subunit 3